MQRLSLRCEGDRVPPGALRRNYNNGTCSDTSNTLTDTPQQFGGCALPSQGSYHSLLRIYAADKRKAHIGGQMGFKPDSWRSPPRNVATPWAPRGKYLRPLDAGCSG